MNILILICIILCTIGLIKSIINTHKEYKHDKETQEKVKRFKYPSEKDDDNS